MHLAAEVAIAAASGEADESMGDERTPAASPQTTKAAPPRKAMKAPPAGASVTKLEAQLGELLEICVANGRMITRETFAEGTVPSGEGAMGEIDSQALGLKD